MYGNAFSDVATRLMLRFALSRLEGEGAKSRRSVLLRRELLESHDFTADSPLNPMLQRLMLAGRYSSSTCSTSAPATGSSAYHLRFRKLPLCIDLRGLSIEHQVREARALQICGVFAWGMARLSQLGRSCKLIGTSHSGVHKTVKRNDKDARFAPQ